MRLIKSVLPVVIVALTTAGCGAYRSDASPDITYAKNAEEARQLQIPPDLTDVSNAEQFVLPGTGGAPLARNTLLPQFSSVSFERNGSQSWLAFEQAPEDLWPQLLAFVRSEKYTVAQTQPIAGTIFTQWRPASAVEKGGLLKNLIGSDEAFSRVGFRMERNGSGTRLFARSQVTTEEAIAASSNAGTDWPASSQNPETTSELLTRLLAFLGIEEQKARGILDVSQVRSIIDNAVVQTNGSGTQLVVYRGFKPSFSAVLAVLEQLEYPVTSSDDGVGRIEFVDDQTLLVLQFSPAHISEVRISLTDEQGARLPAENEQSLLDALRERLA